jgi:hypothetical protein
MCCTELPDQKIIGPQPGVGTSRVTQATLTRALFSATGPQGSSLLHAVSSSRVHIER